jgi:methylmalonyl-CoA mutase N-terminal domain/subunit
MATKKSKSKEPEKKIFTDSNFPVKRIYQKSSKKRTTEDAGKLDFGPCVSILDLEMQS